MESTYDTAVERNLSNVEQKKPTKDGKPRADYSGRKIADAKMMLGIKNDDNRFDDRITKLIKKG